MIGLYVGLAVETKVYLDAEIHGRGKKDAREHLLAFYDQLPSADDFRNVDKSDFHEVFKRVRNDKRKRKERDLSALQQSYVSIGPPPPKS
jgi:hypothetical protein